MSMLRSNQIFKQVHRSFRTEEMVCSLPQQLILIPENSEAICWAQFLQQEEGVASKGQNRVEEHMLRQKRRVKEMAREEYWILSCKTQELISQTNWIQSSF